MSAATSLDSHSFDETRWALDFVTRIVDACPERRPCGEDERRAHGMVRGEMEALGLRCETHSFEWTHSLYANMAFHFGLGALGSIVGGAFPLLGLALHGATAASFFLDSTRKAFTLRKLLPSGTSQNVLGVRAAKSGKPKLRIVFLAHVDAAFTGVVFRPEVATRLLSKPDSVMYKSLRIANASLAALAALDAIQLVTGKSRKLSLARAALTIPSLVAFGFNFDVVLRDQVVPGAMDDLSGVAGMLLLARRLEHRAPDDVEIVYVATGCEESGLGGAQSLADEMEGVWGKAETVVIGLDSLANGDLRFYLEGEIMPVPLSPWLRETLESIAASDARFAEVKPFDIPAGGTDAVPFAVKGWDAVCLGCVDASRGMPREYHLPSDTPENMDAEKIPYCVDFAERLFDAVVARRT